MQHRLDDPASAQAIEVPSPEANNYGEFLDDYQLATLIGGIGNNEGKALLLLAMAQEEGSIYTPRHLHNLITGLPGMDSAEHGGTDTQKSWCQSSIEPSGLVTTLESTGTQITNLGLTLGVPLAGLLLDHADTYGVPLVELFGETRSSSEVSSQFIRSRIIEELLTSPKGMQLTDLVKSSDAADQVVIEKHLRKLANAGLITYEDWDMSASQTRYQVQQGREDDLANKSGFVGSISKYLLDAGTVSHDQIIEHCIKTIPGFDQLDPKIQSSKIASTMFRLKSQNLVQKSEGREQTSELDVSLSSDQLAQWTDLYNKLESLKTQKPEVLAKWTKVAADFIADPEKVKRAYERYRDSSARTNPGEKSLGKIVLSVLQNSDGPSSVREVVKLASSKRGNSVSHSGITTVLNRLADEGLVNRYKDKVLMFSNPQADKVQ